MIFQQITRLFNTARPAFAGVEKSTLAALRKKTGFTFANCKKALEMHENDITLAEKWLNEQAQSLGWAKATKLESRTTAQGLVGVLLRGNIGAIVEVNCETDFVARNEKFLAFVDHVAQVCVKYTDMTRFDGDLFKLGFESEALKNLKEIGGKSLNDQLALLIGSVGENASIRRALCFKTNNELKLYGYAHPSPISGPPLQNVTQFGKYGALIAIRSNFIDEELHKNLCQHIIGLKPEKIGEVGKDTPTSHKDDETCLIYQEYLIDEEKTVGELLKEREITMIDYQRFECGETITKRLLEEADYNNQP